MVRRLATEWGSPREASPGELAVNHGLMKQCVATIIVSLTSLSCGLSMRWLAPTALEMIAGVCSVGDFSATEGLNLSLTTHYAAFFSAVIVGLAANQYGRKSALFLSTVVNLIGGGIIRHPSRANKWAAEVCASCTIITSLMIVPMMVSEIAHSKIRGTLMSSSFLLFHLGVIGAYSVGTYTSHELFNSAYLAISFVQLVLLALIPESPFFLISRSRPLEAEGSLFWYRGRNRSIAKGELAILTKAYPKTRGNVLATLRSPSARNAVLITVGLVFFKCLAGFVMMCCYSSLIFKSAGNLFSVKDAILTVSGFQAAGTFVSMMLIDFIGRKMILYVSQIGNFLSLLVFTVYLMFQKLDADHVSWLPAICLFCFMFSFNLGTGSMSSILYNEVSPVEVKGLVAICDGLLTSLMVLATIEFHPFLRSHVGDYLNFLIPSIINVIGLIFTWAVVPETKGRTLLQILTKMHLCRSDSELVKLEVTKM